MSEISNANAYTGISEFYDNLKNVIDNENRFNDNNKLVVLLRLVTELGSENIGLVETSYLLSKLQSVSLGIHLGREESFNGILEEFDTNIIKSIH